ncbi:MAG: hypothetical protein K8T26_15445 [Lentisphaerae bacterium]|nr:hypothetical protein [Lentisphaerota bacterium]
MRLLKTVLITLALVIVLCLCAPILIGTMFWFTSRSHYNSIEPSKVSTLQIPETDISISLFRKQRPRAICYEGEYRILEVSRPSRTNLYFSLLPTSAGDNPDLKAYWFPTNQCLKIVDSGSRFGSRESLLFLESSTIVHLRHGERDPPVTTEPESAMYELQFPSASAQFSISFTESEVTIPIGDGVLVGTLEEPRKEEDSQSSPGAHSSKAAEGSGAREELGCGNA